MLAVPALGAFGYLWVILWFAARQRDFEYSPGGSLVAPETVGLDGFAAVEIPTEDGERIVAWWAAPSSVGGVVLFLHGTPSTLPDTVWRLPDLRKSGLGVMAIDYRGYGGSTGTPSELGLGADARAAFDFHAAAPGSRIARREPRNRHCGCPRAWAASCRRPPQRALCLGAAVVRLARAALPYRLLLTDQFDSEALIAGVRVPVMILHGTADESVPVTEARRLYAAAHEPKTMIEVEGAGHSAPGRAGQRRRRSRRSPLGPRRAARPVARGDGSGTSALGLWAGVACPVMLARRTDYRLNHDPPERRSGAGPQ